MRALGDEQAPRRFEMTATDLLDDPTVRGLVLNYRDIAERALFQERLTQQAFHDALTGLPNRALFQDRLEHALRQEGELSPCCSSIWTFKVVNGSRGHDAGDQLLCDAAKRRPAVCGRGTLARLGGDAFTVLLRTSPMTTKRWRWPSGSSTGASRPSSCPGSPSSSPPASASRPASPYATGPRHC